MIDMTAHVHAALNVLGNIAKYDQGSTIEIKLNVGLDRTIHLRLVYCVDMSDPVGYWKFQT